MKRNSYSDRSADDFRLPLRIKNQLNAFHFLEDGELNDLPHLTVPDRTLSIREIVDRYQRGSMLPGLSKEEIWDEEEELPDPTRLDISEREELKASMLEELSTLKSKYNGKKNEPKETSTDVRESSAGDELPS